MSTQWPLEGMALGCECGDVISVMRSRRPRRNMDGIASMTSASRASDCFASLRLVGMGCSDGRTD